MLQVKLPYYPKVQAMQHVTSFGVSEVDQAYLYDKPLPNNKVIVRVDTLRCLQDTIGYEPFICREFLYAIMAGESAKYDPLKVFASYYRKYKGVTNYVNDCYFFGNDEVPIFERAVKPLRARVDNYRDRVKETLFNMGGKYLVESKDFVYFAFNGIPDVSALEGAVIIC